MPVPGDVLLGKYQIEHILGQGGMGVVLSARHLDLGELFAIKLLLPQALSQPQAVPRFLREARAAARLRSEHVAKVVDVGRLEDGAPYMVLEHLSGHDLKVELTSNGPLGVGEAVAYVLQCCEAIAEAHALGIIHRDLKPANLFLTRRLNGTPCVKVLDFGISRQIVPEGLELTRTGFAFGSPLYMAPEQMARTKDADARSDIWSLGVVLYELVAGRVPFFGDTITEVVAAALQQEHIPPSHIRSGIPASFDDMIARCLQKRSDHRFQRVEDLIAALRLIRTDVARATAPMPFPPPWPRDSAHARRESIPTIAAAPSAIVDFHPTVPLDNDLVPVIPTGSSQTISAGWANTSSASPSRLNRNWVAGAFAGGIALLVTIGGVWLVMRSPAETDSTTRPAAGTVAAPTSAPAKAPGTSQTGISSATSPTVPGEPTAANSPVSPTSATTAATPSSSTASIRPPSSLAPIRPLTAPTFAPNAPVPPAKTSTHPGVW